MLHIDLELSVANFVQSVAGELTPEQVDEAIKLALIKLDADKPHRVIDDVDFVDGVGSLPNKWQSDTSKIHQAEYPIGLVPASMVAVEVYNTPDGQTLRSNVTGKVRLTYTAPHHVDDVAPTETTLTNKTYEAVARYAASILCQQLAAKYANDDGVTYAVDSVDHGDKSRKYNGLYKSHLQRYTDLVGGELGVSQVALAVSAPPPRKRFNRRGVW